MQWTQLTECKDDSFYRGVVLRFPAKHPFEGVVDFMLIEDHDAPALYKLICSTGYHAGQTELVFPLEAKHPAGGVSVTWLRENWKKWIYVDCEVHEVRFIKSYEANFGA
jgi:hypothetical protein